MRMNFNQKLLKMKIKPIFLITIISLIPCFIACRFTHLPDSSFQNDTQANSYLLSSEIKDSLDRFKGIEPQQLAVFNYSFIGEYKKSLSIWDALMGKTPKILVADSIYFRQFKPINAKKYIIEQAKLNRIIIINEAHHQPLHRVFTTELLRELHDLGYDYLGVEDLNYRDSFLSTRKYPIIQSGYFAREPQFGNLIREGLNLGFSLVPYDFDSENFYDERDKNAAKHLKKIFDKDPNAKLIIHCGYDHVFESEASIGKPLAQYLAELTGINPLTIDQENFTEKSETRFESPFLQLSKITESSIYINEFGNVFTGRIGQKKVDIKVFHPPSIYYFERPTWLLNTQSKNWFFFPLEKINIAFPILIQVYKKGENASAVPIDIIELTTSDTKKPLALYKGDYSFKISNGQKEHQEINIKIE